MRCSEPRTAHMLGFESMRTSFFTREVADLVSRRVYARAVPPFTRSRGTVAVRRRTRRSPRRRPIAACEHRA